MKLAIKKIQTNSSSFNYLLKVRKFALVRKFKKNVCFYSLHKETINFFLSSGIGGFPLKTCRDYRSGKADYEELGSLSSLVSANVSQSQSKTEMRKRYYLSFLAA